MLFGVLLLLERLGILVEGLRLWPVALIGLGVWVWAEPRQRRSRAWGTVLVLVGTWLLLTNFGVIAVGFWQLVWPLLIIWLGVTLMRQTLWRRRLPVATDWSCASTGPIVDAPGPEPPSPNAPSPDAPPSPGAAPIPDASSPGATSDARQSARNWKEPIKPGNWSSGNWSSWRSQPHASFFPNVGPWADGPGTISLFAALAASKRASTDSPFRGGDMTAFMGGCHLDLRLATIPRGGEAVIDVFTLMGGLEIWVPPGWAIVNQVLPFMGGVDDKRLPPLEPVGSPDTRPRLVLRGMVVMGGLMIKN